MKIYRRKSQNRTDEVLQKNKILVGEMGKPMIYSMTGYGRAQEVIDGMEITAEIKSVNHRFFEFSARVPRIYGYLEEKIKSYLQTKIARGKIDVYISFENYSSMGTNVRINRELAKEYLKELKTLSEEADIKYDVIRLIILL